MTWLDWGARDRLLKQRVAAVRTLPDLRRALLLDAWRDDDPDMKLAAVHKAARADLARRFAQAVRAVLQTGDPTSRRAVADMIADIGATARGIDTRAGLMREFAPDLAAALKQPDPAVRQAAARALGQINPDPAVAVPALSGLLSTGSVADRTAAAAALGNLVRAALLNYNPGDQRRTTTGVDVSPAELVALDRAVLPVAGRTLRDPSPAVRRQGSETVHQVATAVGQLVGDPPELGEELVEPRRVLKEEQAFLAPLLTVLNEQLPGLAGILGDADLSVCLAANEALEAVADVRQRLLGRAAAIARQIGEKPAPDDPLRDGLRTALRPLAEELSHRNVRVRLAALYVVESLEAEAAPLAAGVVGTLRDEDAFVRWAAARALGRMAPHGADKAVPELARLLDDANGDVRSTAVAALERYGPAAKAAVPELRRALGRKDAVLRVAILHVLQAVGKEARPAVPEVLTALTAPEVSVRVAAARVLGRAGAADRETEEALRRALDDADADVRQAAADALLTGK
jgi:HEAT repeat protein